MDNLSFDKGGDPHPGGFYILEMPQIVRERVKMLVMML